MQINNKLLVTKDKLLIIADSRGLHFTVNFLSHHVLE